MLGDAPGLPDALCYYLVWFVRGRWQGGPALLSEFPALEAWEQRVKPIGNGKPTEMSAAEALEVARASQPATPEQGEERVADGAVQFVQGDATADRDVEDAAWPGQRRHGGGDLPERGFEQGVQR